jgi:heat shock protein HtpX
MQQILIPLAASTVPGLYAWWSGRRMVALLDDPSFADLLLARSGRIIKVLAVSWALSMVFGGRHAYWAVPLAMVSVLVGGFPARKAIFAEQWSLFGFLGHHMRLVLGMLGSWFLVFAAPGVFIWFADPLIVSAMLLVAAVLAWNGFGAGILLWLLRASPLEDRALLERFDEVVAKSRCPAANIYRAGPHGGSWVNGFALPTPWAPAVLLTDGLVHHLDEREVTAIFAHEVAHLEQFTSLRYVVRVALGPILVTLLAAAFMVLEFSPPTATAVALIWPLVCLVLLGASLARSRKDETESDLRAVELTGDPDALARGLTKVYELNRQPRRLDVRLQKRVTHPSLARRLQAIRRAAGSEAKSEVDSVALVEKGGERVVLLLAERMQILEGIEDPTVPTDELLSRASRSESIKYSELQGLRVDARGAEKRQLVATDRKGTRTTIPLEADDANRAQRFLDHVDLHIGVAAPGDKGDLGSPERARILGLIALIASLIHPFTWSLAITALVVVAWPSRTAMAAAGVTALMGLFAEPAITLGLMGEGQATTSMAIQGVIGVWLLVIALLRYRRRIEDRRRDARLAIGLVVSFAILTAVLGSNVLGSPSPVMQLHLWMRWIPGSVMLLAGACLALALVRDRRARTAAVFGALAVGLLLVAGSPWFRAQVGRELLSEAPPDLAARTARLDRVRSLDFDHPVYSIALSPSGQRVAVAARGWEEYDYGDRAGEFVVETPFGTTSVRGIVLQWADDASVVSLVPDTVGLLLRHRNIETGAEWQTSLPDLHEPQLSVRAGRWSVVARDSTAQGLVQWHGSLGADEAMVRKWQLPEAEESWVQSGHATLDGSAILVAANAMQWSRFPFLGSQVSGPSSEIWIGTSAGRLRHLGSTLFTMRCFDADRSTPHLCLTSWNGASEIWSLAPDGTVRPIGHERAWMWAEGTSDALVVLGRAADLLVLDGGEPRVRLVRDRDLPSGETEWRQSQVYRAGVLAVAQGTERRATVTLYTIE